MKHLSKTFTKQFYRNMWWKCTACCKSPVSIFMFQ